MQPTLTECTTIIRMNLFFLIIAFCIAFYDVWSFRLSIKLKQYLKPQEKYKISTSLYSTDPTVPSGKNLLIVLLIILQLSSVFVYKTIIIKSDLQPISSITENGAETIKSDLFALAASCDRGFGASISDTRKAATLIEKLRLLNPTENPTINLYPNNSNQTANATSEINSNPAPLEGVWKLVYTTAFDVVSLAASPLTLLQGIYQVISRDGRSANVIDLAPRLQAALPQFLVGEGISTVRLIVGTASSARSNTRVGLTFKSITVQPLSFLGRRTNVDFLPQFSSILPQAALLGGRDGPGYFDILYLDYNCLIIAQNSPGGIFVNIRSDENSLNSFLK